MSKYKVGDKVRIIRALGSSVERGLKYGDETEIIQTSQSSSGHTDYILRCPDPLYVGDGGFFLEHEIEPVVADRPQTKKQKHIFIRVDKQIEPGDLVRCINDDYPCKVGDIRKAKQWGSYALKAPGLFRINSKGVTAMIRRNWEVVRKLKVGDYVSHVKSGRSSRVTEVYPEANRFQTKYSRWCDPDHFCIYREGRFVPTGRGYDGLMQYAEADSIPVGKAYGINKVESDAEISLEGALAQSINDMMAPIADGSRRLFAPKPDRKAEMQKAVAEMVVELLDKKTEVKLGAYTNTGLTMIDDHFPRRNLGCAELAKSDEWDTLTGLYVALSKATNRKLPDWMYEKENNDE